MEPLTATRGRWPGWVLHGVLLLVLLLGPAILSRVISGVTSTITWPLTQELRFADNRFEIFNTELLLIYLIAVLGLNLLKQVGLLSLGASALFAVGAYTVAIGTTTFGMSFWAVFVLAVVGSAVLGLVMGIPALRLGLFTFAMVTVGYAFVAESFAFEWRGLTGGGDGIHGISHPEPFGELELFYWLVAGVVVVAYLLMRNLIRSPFGRSSKAVEQSIVAAQSLGIDDYVVKLRVFTVSSVFAAVAGALYAPLLGFVAPDSAEVNLAILLVLMVLIGGAGTVAGPVIGTVLLFRIPIEIERVADSPGAWSLLIYGVILLLSVHFVPKGVMSGWWWIRARLPARVRRWIRFRELDRVPAQRLADVVTPAERAEGPALETRHVTKNLGGVQALDGLDLTVESGTVHALIGPNGSGKTTFLNIVSGYMGGDEGQVRLLGRDVTARRPHRRSRIGLGRTFQTPVVFADITCHENVLTALDQSRRHNLVAYAVRAPGTRREERRQCHRAMELLEAVGLGHRADAPAAALPPGERRLLELARVLALGPSVVLLDEPAAGLSSEEVEQLEAALATMREAGLGLLLIEHHVDFVLRLADVVTVIDHGTRIAHGPPEEVKRDPSVIAAYLGQPASAEEAGDGAEIAGSRTAGSEDAREDMPR